MKEETEIEEIIKDIQDIEEQEKAENPDRKKLQTINIKAKAKFPKETLEYETSCVIMTGNNTININDASVSLLLSRLPFYKTLYLKKLEKIINKVEQKNRNNI